MPRTKAVAKRLPPPATRTSQSRESKPLLHYLIGTISTGVTDSCTAGCTSQTTTLIPHVDDKVPVIISGPVKEPIEEVLERCVDTKQTDLCNLTQTAARIPAFDNLVNIVDNDDSLQFVKETINVPSRSMSPFTEKRTKFRGRVLKPRKCARVAEKKSANQRCSRLNSQGSVSKKLADAANNDVHTKEATVRIDLDRCWFIKPIPDKSVESLRDVRQPCEDQHPRRTKLFHPMPARHTNSPSKKTQKAGQCLTTVNESEVVTGNAIQQISSREDIRTMGMQEEKDAVFVKSGCMRTWRLLNVMPEKPFHASMFIDMEQKSLLGDAVRIGISQDGEVRVVAFSKMKCGIDDINRLLQWWKENSRHFVDVTKMMPVDDVLTTLS